MVRPADDRIVAVVPAWRARDRLTAVLRALSGQVAAVVVVDNASEDGTATWLADVAAGGTLGVEVAVIANEQNRGYAAAVNQGLARALERGGTAVLLVNDDAVFTPGAVAALVAALAEPGVGAATARLQYRDRPGVLNGAGGVVDRHRAWATLRGAGTPDDGRYDDRPAVDYPSGAASLLSGAAIQAVGPLDEAWYLYYEDADWGLRAGAAGWRTVYVPGARVVHIGSAGTAADPARRRYYNVRNRLRFAGRHCGGRGRAWAWGATLWLLAKQPLRWLTPQRRRDAEAVVFAVADHLRGRYGRSGRFG
jgi:GT2 family glycosyltransferase